MDIYSRAQKYVVGGTLTDQNFKGYALPQKNNTPTFDIHNLGASLVNAGKGIVSGIGHNLTAAGDVLNKLISGNVNVANVTRQNQDTERQFQALMANKSKLSPAAFKAGLKSIQRSSQEESQTAAGISFPTAPELIGGLTETASLPFAFGKLAGPAAGLTGLTEGGSVASSIAKAPIKYALIDKPLSDQAAKTTEDIQNKNITNLRNDALLMGATVALPGVAGKVAGPAVTAIKNKTFGIRSFLDEIPTADKKISEFVGTAGGNYKNVAKVFQKYNLDQSSGNVSKAVNKYVQWLGGSERSAQFTAKQHLDKFEQFVKDVEMVRKDAKAGLIPHPGGGKWNKGELNNLWVGRFEQGEKKALVDALGTAGSAAEREQIALDLAKSSDWGQNTYLRDQVIADARSDNFSGIINKKYRGTGSLDKNIFAIEDTGKPMSEEFLKATGGPLKETPKRTTTMSGLGEGHFPIVRKAGTDFTAAKEAPEIVKGVQPNGALGAVGKFLRKTGLSPETAAPIGDKIALSFRQELAKANPVLEAKADTILGKLYSETNRSAAVLDPRLLKMRDIRYALGQAGVGVENARLVRRSLDNAYQALSYAERGAGGKLTDLAIKYVPGERQFLKAQSYGRFALNPFFATKVGLKTGYIAALENEGGRIAGPVAKDVQTYIRSKGKEFEGVATDILAGSHGQLRPGVVGKFQENVAGNMVQNILKNNNATIADLKSNPQLKKAVDEAVQIVYGYPKEGFLSSNFAKSMNLILFPARFEAKIAMVTGKYLAKQPALVRAAVVNGIVRGNSFLNSPEGQQWQKDNSELVGIAKYFTPADTLHKVLNVLSGQGDESLKDLGQIGGLPFGVITQILSGQGVPLGPLASSPYKHPKTGEELPKQIPESNRARAFQALADLIGQMYSYPGKQVGLPSKADLTAATIKFASGGTLDKDKLRSEYRQEGGSTKPVETQNPFLRRTPSPTQPLPSELSVPTRASTIKPPAKKRLKVVPKNLQLSR